MNASQSPCLVSSPSLMTSMPAARCSATTHSTAARSVASSGSTGSNPGGPGRLPTCVVKIFTGGAYTSEGGRKAPICGRICGMPDSTTRRAVLTGAAAAAAVSLTPPRAGAQAASRRFQPARHSQDEWLDTVPGKHRTFIDCASVNAAGAGMLYANNLYVANAKGYQLKEADVAVVVCLRHFATIFAFNDALWDKYGQALSDAVEFADPKTKQAPTKNLLDDPSYAQLPVATISPVVKRGTHFAVCDMATN